MPRASLSQPFLHPVLEICEAPLAFRFIVEGLYFIAFGYMNMLGHLVFFVWFKSGVMQGCPLSGTLFQISFDAFLWEMTAEIDDKGLELSVLARTMLEVL